MVHINKNCLLIYLYLINLFKPELVCMLTVQFNCNLYYIVHKRGNRHSNSILKELRKLMDLPRATAKNVCANFCYVCFYVMFVCFNVCFYFCLLRMFVYFFFLILASQSVLVSFLPSLFIHLLIRIKLNLYQHDLIKALNSYSHLNKLDINLQI